MARVQRESAGLADRWCKGEDKQERSGRWIQSFEFHGLVGSEHHWSRIRTQDWHLEFNEFEILVGHLGKTLDESVGNVCLKLKWTDG